MDMPEDDLAVILRNHLLVEDKSLRILMFEILEMCQSLGGPAQAVTNLNAKRLKFSSEIDFLDKTPYIYLFLAYARYKQNKRYYALRWIKAAIDRFDQLNQVWNRSIARWICALIYKQSGQPDDAGFYFEAATKLMKQEIHDLKRRSRYEKAEECEFVLDQLRRDNGFF
jgi:tetratricopeptide (TPR) repeat protein